MKIGDILYITFKNMAFSVGRIILPTIAVAIGTASVILISSIGRGTAEEAETQFNALGVDGICVTISGGSFCYDTAERVEANVENVDRAVLFDYSFGSASAHQRRNKIIAFGTSREPCAALGIEILYGRDIRDADIMHNGRVVVVGEEYAESAYDRINIVGKSIRLTIDGKTGEYEVIGVVKSQTERFKTLLGADPGNIMYMPYSTLGEIKNVTGTENMAVKLKNTSDSDKTVREIIRAAKRSYNTDSTFEVKDISSYLEKARGIINGGSLLITAVGAISMLVAVIGVMNSALAGLDRKKHEIGLLMSIGALDSQIKLYIILESIFTCVLGSIFGLLITILIGFFMKKTGSIPFSIDYTVLMATEASSVVCGLSAGMIPAFKAASMEPVDVLRRG